MGSAVLHHWIIAGLFGIPRIPSGASEIARVCCFFFVIVFVVSLIWHLVTGRRIPPPLQASPHDKNREVVDPQY